MKNKAIPIWLFSGCFLVFVMVIVGGITRLTGSGLSIVEWNLISGTLPPLNQEEWNIAFEKYQQFPQYKKINSGMDLNEFKFIFFWEYIHRLLGRIIGFIFIIPFAIFYYQKQLNRKLIRRLFLILILGALQGFMGWFMVKSGLVDNPHVSHYRLATHFLLACLLISMIYITVLDTTQSKKYPTTKTIYRISILIISLLTIQLVYGAFTAGLKAGFAYNTFPDMNGEWFPNGMLSLEPAILNFLDNGITIQFMHRLLGSILLITSISATFYVHLVSRNSKIKLYFTLLSFLVSFQFILGILTLLNKVPIFLGVLHQATAVITLLASVHLVYSLKIITTKDSN